jgi:hypothetical protein
MDSSFRSFLWVWLGSTIVGFIAVWSWCTGNNPITAWRVTFQHIYAVNVVPIMKNPLLSVLILIFPTLVLYVFFAATIKVNKRSDDFILNVALQEAQGLWLGVSLGFIFFFISTATSSDPTINQAQDTSALASFILTSLLYASKRRNILRLHVTKRTLSTEK